MSKFKRGNSTNLPSPSDGNIIYCKDTHQLLVDNANSHNGIVAEGLNKNGYSASFDFSGNISFPKKVMANGRDVTELVTYDGTTTSLDLTYPAVYTPDPGNPSGLYDVFSVGKYIKVTKQSDGSFLLENTSSSSTGQYYDNSIGLCTGGGDYKLGLSLQLKQKTYQSSSEFCKVIRSQFGMVSGSSYPSTLSSTTNFVSVNPPELQAGSYYYYLINVPYGCSCYVKDINITVNDNVISQVIGYRGTLDPVEYHNIKSKTDSVLNTFGGTSYDITPFFVFHHTISKNDWTDNTAKLPVPTDILDYLLTPLILGYDMSTADDFDMCANAKIVVGNFPDYDSGSDSYFYQITALGTVPTKSITIYYTFLTESTSL